MGIEHVYDSRSIEFADQIRRDTDGYGVDIVLNSLTGAAQRAGLELLAFGGRFVEIGKRDIYGDTRLGLFPFRRNLSFYAVDLALMSFSHPDRLRDLLNTVYQLTADGVAADAGEHALPACRRGHRHPGDGRAPSTPASSCSTSRTAGQQQRGGAAGAGPGLPRRRRLHHHRRAGWPGAVPGREDGRGRLRAHRADLALAADSQGAGDHRAHPRDRGRHRGGVRRHRRTRHRASGWWRWRPPPGFRCAVCCTRRRWSRTPR